MTETHDLVSPHRLDHILDVVYPFDIGLLKPSASHQIPREVGVGSDSPIDHHQENDPYGLSCFPFCRFADSSVETAFVQFHYGVSLGFFRLLGTAAVILFVYVLIVQVFFSPTATEWDAIQVWVDGFLRGVFQVGVGSAVWGFVWILGCVACQRTRKRTKAPPGAIHHHQNSQLMADSWRCCCVSPVFVRELVDVALAFYFVAIAAVQGFMGGFANPNMLPPYLMPVLTGFALLYRIRVFPSFVIVSICCFSSVGIGVGARYAIRKDLSPTMTWEGGLQLAEAVVLSCVSGCMAMLMERSARNLFIQTSRHQGLYEALGRESTRQDVLVRNVFPVELLPILLQRGRYYRRFDNMAVLVNDIRGFTEFCSSISSVEVFRFLNEVYSSFDSIALSHGLEKLKTVGDSWIGITFRKEDDDEFVMEEGGGGGGDSVSQRQDKAKIRRDATVVVLSAIEMMNSFQSIVEKKSVDGMVDSRGNVIRFSLSIRTGVAIGSALVYVLGSGAESSGGVTFDLLGPAIEEASLLESVAAVGEIWCSQQVHGYLAEEKKLVFERREMESGQSDDTQIAYSVSIVPEKKGVTPSIRQQSPPCLTSILPESGSCVPTDVDAEVDEEIAGVRPTEKILLMLRRFLLCRRSWRETCCSANDLYSLQVSFVRVCFLATIAVMIYLLAVLVVEFWLLPSSRWYLIGIFIALDLLIVACCVIGTVLAGKSSFVGIGLQWLVFCLDYALGVAVFVWCSCEDFRIRRVAFSYTSAFTLPLPTLMFPSIPLLAKILCGFFFPSLSWAMALFWTNEFKYFKAWIQNYFQTLVIIWIGIYLHQYTVLNEFEQDGAVRKGNAKLQEEVRQNGRLLRSALPQPIIQTLLSKGHQDHCTVYADSGGVIFCLLSGLDDFGSGAGETIVIEVERLFEEFDGLLAANGLTKIKNTGLRYIAVAGLEPLPSSSSLELCLVRVALRMLNVKRDPRVSVRIGIHLGPFTGGICGTSKWLFDVFGDAVNCACRLSEIAEENQIFCSFAGAWDGLAKTRSVGMRSLKGKGLVEVFELGFLIED